MSFINILAGNLLVILGALGVIYCCAIIVSEGAEKKWRNTNWGHLSKHSHNVPETAAFRKSQSSLNHRLNETRLASKVIFMSKLSA